MMMELLGLEMELRIMDVSFQIPLVSRHMHDEQIAFHAPS